MDESSLNKKSDDNRISGKSFDIESDRDLIEMRDFGREMAGQIGFASNDQTLISTALSEICRNVLEYAGSGEVLIEADRAVNPSAIRIVVSDRGPGIENIKMALKEGYSTGRGLGIGLPGAKRIMDQFEINSEMGKGTTIRMSKRLDRYEF
jgi:serine/threonine-protein kinase RsbT